MISSGWVPTPGFTPKAPERGEWTAIGITARRNIIQPCWSILEHFIASIRWWAESGQDQGCTVRLLAQQGGGSRVLFLVCLLRCVVLACPVLHYDLA